MQVPLFKKSFLQKLRKSFFSVVGHQCLLNHHMMFLETWLHDIASFCTSPIWLTKLVVLETTDNFFFHAEQRRNGETLCSVSYQQ
jgi:hypothetical protein